MAYPLLLIASLLAPPVFTRQEQAAIPLISKAWRAEDPALDKPVTARVHATIGEALEQLSASSGVQLSCGKGDGAADPAIFVSCVNVPVYKMLNAIWSAVSYRQGAWKWERSGEAGHWSYRLVQPAKARQVRDLLYNWAQERFEASARTLLAAVDGGQKGRDAAIKEVYEKDPQAESPGYWSGRLWIDIKALKEGLSAEQQTALFRGGPDITVPMSSLGDEARDYLITEWRRLHGSAHPEGTPDTATFTVRKYGSTPTLYLLVSGLGAPAEIGGIPLEEAYHKLIRKSFVTPEDSAEDPALDRPLKPGEFKYPVPPAPVRRTQWNIHAEILVERLDDICAATGLPVVCRLPEDDADAMTSWAVTTKTLRDWWALVKRHNIMYKWHDGVQVISTEAWPLEDPPVPLALLRRLRADAKPGEFLPMADLVAAAAAASPKALLRLGGEFPVMEGVSRVGPMLIMLAKNPALVGMLQRDGGVPITPDLASVLKEVLPPALFSRIERGEAVRVQLLKKETPMSDSQPATRDISMRLLAANGDGIQSFGFYETARPKPKAPPPTGGDSPRPPD